MNKATDLAQASARDDQRRRKVSQLAEKFSSEPDFERALQEACRLYVNGRHWFLHRAEYVKKGRRRATEIRAVAATLRSYESLFQDAPEWESTAKIDVAAAAAALTRLADQLHDRMSRLPKTKPRAHFLREVAQRCAAALELVGIKPTAHASAEGASSQAVSLLVGIARAAGDRTLNRESARKYIAAAIRQPENTPSPKSK